MMRECYYLWHQSDRPHGLLKIRYTEVSKRGVWAKVVGVRNGAVHPGRDIEVDERRCFDDEHEAMRALTDARRRQEITLQWDILRAIRAVQAEQGRLREQFEVLRDHIGMMGNDLSRIDAHLRGDD